MPGSRWSAKPTPDRRGLPYDVIQSSGVPDQGSWYYQGFLVPGDPYWKSMPDMLAYDPVMAFFATYSRPHQVKRYFVRHVSAPTEQCYVLTRNVYMRGIVLLANMYRAAVWGSRSNYVSANWKHRRSLSLSGTSSNLAYTRQWFWQSFAIDVPLPVWLSELHLSVGGYWFHSCPFEDIMGLASVIKKGVGGRFTTGHGLGRYSAATLISVSVTDLQVVVVWGSVHYEGYPSGKSQDVPQVTITYTRGKPSESIGFHVHVGGLETLYIDNSYWFETSWVTSTSTKVTFDLATRYETLLLLGGESYAESEVHSTRPKGPLSGLIGAFDDNISVYSPGLFRSQGVALNRLMADVGSNFENIIQSAQFVTMINGIINSDNATTKRVLSKPADGVNLSREFSARCKMITDAICGGYLAYSWGIRPAVEAVQKLAKEQLGPTQAEGEWIIEGEDFMSEDKSFRDALLMSSPVVLKLDPSLIRQFKIKFRTTAYTSTTYAALAKAYLLSDAFAHLHGYPTAMGLYESMQYSFALDWLIDLGPDILANQSYFTSPSLPLVIGHTVDVRFRTSDSRHFKNFWRSVASNYPIEPTGPSWARTFQFPFAAIPFGVQQLWSGLAKII